MRSRKNAGGGSVGAVSRRTVRPGPAPTIGQDLKEGASVPTVVMGHLEGLDRVSCVRLGAPRGWQSRTRMGESLQRAAASDKTEKTIEKIPEFSAKGPPD